MSIQRVVVSVWAVVWVLLQPPVQSDGQVVSNAPLVSWLVNGEFPTREKCEANRSASQAALAYGAGEAQVTLRTDGAAAVVFDSRCIELSELKKMLRPAPVLDDE